MNVQLQTTSLCSGKCIICPYLDSWHKRRPGRMSEAVFQRILEQLAPLSLGKICVYLENEPLLDPGIFQRIAAIKQSLRYTSLEFSTNAKDLDPQAAGELAELLCDAPHEIWISFHGVDRRTHEGVMGLEYERCLDNTLHLLTLADKLPLRVVIRGAGQGVHPDLRHDFEFSEAQFRAFWEEQARRKGVKARLKLNWFRYHDRAGAIRRNHLRLNQPIRPDLHGFACPRVDQWLHFLYTGDLTLCCMDYHREAIFGNIVENSLQDILEGQPYLRLRNMVTGVIDSPTDFICKRCISPGG